MDFIREYNEKLKTPEEAVKVVKSGDWVDYVVGLGVPELLDSALAKRKEELFDVKIRGYLVLHPLETVESDPTREHFYYNSWYMSGYERKLCDKGLCNFMPMIYRNLPSYYRKGHAPVNVAMMQVSKMDPHGYFYFSLGCASARAVMDVADYIILEVNENLPNVQGTQNVIHISEVDAIVEGEHGPLPTLSPVRESETDRRIAEWILPHIVDGATLQIGIGSMPAALGHIMAQSDLKDLGMHTELLSDAYLELARAGKLTNRRKRHFRGKGVFATGFGSQELYDWVDDNPGLIAFPLEYVNSAEVIGQHDNMVSICSCIATDLYCACPPPTQIAMESCTAGSFRPFPVISSLLLEASPTSSLRNTGLRILLGAQRGSGRNASYPWRTRISGMT